MTHHRTHAVLKKEFIDINLTVQSGELVTLSLRE